MSLYKILQNSINPSKKVSWDRNCYVYETYSKEDYDRKMNKQEIMENIENKTKRQIEFTKEELEPVTKYNTRQNVFYYNTALPSNNYNYEYSHNLLLPYSAFSSSENLNERGQENTNGYGLIKGAKSYSTGQGLDLLLPMKNNYM